MLKLVLIQVVIIGCNLNIHLDMNNEINSITHRQWRNRRTFYLFHTQDGQCTLYRVLDALQNRRKKQYPIGNEMKSSRLKYGYAINLILHSHFFFNRNTSSKGHYCNAFNFLTYRMRQIVVSYTILIRKREYILLKLWSYS